MSASGPVEVHLTFRPEHYQVWPTFAYSERTNPENQFILSFEGFGRSENARIEILQTGIEPPNVIRVRTPEKECKFVVLNPMRTFPQWFYILTMIIVLVGLYATALFIVRAFSSLL